MAYGPTRFGQDPQYEQFLHGPVGEDSCGTSVTMLSMLARLGGDPWGDVSDLAAMPDGAARQRLDALMARFTDVPSFGPSRAEAVSRLHACLPSLAKVAPASLPSLPNAQARATFIYWLVAIGFLLACVGMQAHGN